MPIPISKFLISKKIHVDELMKKELWNPHVQFYKVKDVELSKGFGYDRYHRFEYEKLSSPKYRFRKSEVMTLKIPCKFNFDDFPFDTNQCNVTFFELRFFKKININIISMNFEGQKIFNRNESIFIHIPKSPFEILVTIGEHEKWSWSGVVSITLKRVSLGLLLG